jgi:AcrR family transcriptional regulator
LNFDNKEAVLLRCLKRLFDDIMQLVRYKQIDSVDALVATYTDVVENNAVYFKALADNNLTGLACHLFSNELVQLPPVLPSQRENQTTAERRYFNAFWVAAFIEVYALWLSEGMKTDRSEINRILTDIMLGNYFR